MPLQPTHFPEQPPPSAPDSVPPDTPPDDEKPNRDWIRKAHSRRLKANRQDATEEVYEPRFAARRESDWATPEFDREAEAPPPESAAAPAPAPPEALRNWMILFAAIVVILLTTALGVLLWHRDYFDSARRASAEEQRKAAEDTGGGKERNLLEIVPEIRKTVEGFFAATTPQEKTAFVRGGEAMLPAMRDWYAIHPDEAPVARFGDEMEPVTLNTRRFIHVSGTTAHEAFFHTVVEQTSRGIRLDWRGLTGAAEMEWSQWLRERPQRAVLLRVNAKLDDFYEGDFSDRKVWVCVRVTGPAGSDGVWAYARRGEPASRTVFRGLSRKSDTIQMQARFSFPNAVPAGEHFRKVQVLLESVENKGWLDHSSEAAATSDPVR